MADGDVVPIPTLPDDDTNSADVPPFVERSRRLILEFVPLPSNTALGFEKADTPPENGPIRSPDSYSCT